jgi:hypothetical protein
MKLRKPNKLERLYLFLFGWSDTIGTGRDKLTDFMNKYEKRGK